MNDDNMSEDERNVIEAIDFNVEAAADDGRIPDNYQTEEKFVEHQSMLQRVIEKLSSDKKAIIGGMIVLAFIITAIFAPLIAPYDPGTTYEPLQPLNSYSVGNYDNDPATERIWHPLGTDSFGHDMLSRIIFGARISLLVAFGTLLFAFVIGTSIGILAGYYKGWIDTALMRVVDYQWAFPELILAVGVIAMTGSRGVINVIIAVGIAYIDDFARLIRSEVLTIREEEYIQAAQAIGMTDLRTMTNEVLPNALAPLIVQATIMIPLAIIAEASLSFLGLGVNPTTPTWGILINQGRKFITQAWWLCVMPGLAIMITVIGFNLFGDGLRDALDVEEQEVDMR
jgi:peptide/nickel transport system permease protein